MRPHTPAVTTDNIFTSNAADISTWTSTSGVNDEFTPLFLQTPGAKAIAGVFAFASILVTCVQVSYVYIFFRVKHLYFNNIRNHIYMCKFIFMHIVFFYRL